MSDYKPIPQRITASATAPSMNEKRDEEIAYELQQQEYAAYNQQQQKPYGNTYASYNPSYHPSAQVNPSPYAVATAVSSYHGPPSASSFNASTYSGGPTNGLVSQGNPTICHKIDFEIKGQEMQLVEIQLDPQETVIAEAGAMMFLEDNIDFKAKFGDGSNPHQGFFGKLMAAGGRILTGESLFLTHFTNQGSHPARVAFAAPYPGTIVPINMAEFNNKLICQKQAFLCAAFGTKLSLYFNRRLGSGLFGGEGFILEKLEGDGMAFVHAGGCVIRRELRGDRIRLDTGCLVAFTEGINYDITLVPGLKSILFGGEGLFLATLQGYGTVWMQSLPFSRMCDRIIQNAPSIGGRRTDEGSALTGRLGDILDGDGFGGLRF